VVTTKLLAWAVPARPSNRAAPIRCLRDMVVDSWKRVE
jgi:hypothetical protein